MQYDKFTSPWSKNILTSNEEKEPHKDAIRKVGGGVNQSGVFFATTSTVTVVSKVTGINQCSVAYIPHSKMTLDILEGLDACINAYIAHKTYASY